jgi:hypothetical protein
MAAAALVLVLVGCAPTAGGPSDTTSTEGTTKAPVQVGMITSATSALAAYGEAYTNGFKAGLDYATDGTGAVDGREIDITWEDDQGNPGTAVAKAKDEDSAAALAAAHGRRRLHRARGADAASCHRHPRGVPRSVVHTGNPATPGLTATLFDGITQHTIQTPRLAAGVLERPGDDGAAPVVFIHGNVSSSLFWQPLMLALPAGLRALAIDLRGFGASETLPVDATRGVRDFADDVASVLEALAVDRAHIIGWSMGGGVAMQLLLDHPEVVATLTLIAPVSPYGFGGRRSGRTGAHRRQRRRRWRRSES